MKILYIVNFFPPLSGAAALNSWKITQFLEKFGHEILVLAPSNMAKSFQNSKKIKTKSDNIKIIYSSSLIPVPLSFLWSHFENLFSFFLNLDFHPDLILSQYHAFHYASVAGALLSRKLKIPHVVRSHDIFIDLPSHSWPYQLYTKMNYPLNFRSIKKTDIFYLTASEQKHYLSKIEKLKATNFRIHHNGIDVDQFYPNPDDQLKKKYGCDKIISFIGLINEGIGLHNFISILPDFFKEHRETHLIIIGDGPYKDAVLKVVKRKGLSKQVHFLGIKPHVEIPFYINNTDIGLGRITHKRLWRYMIPVKCLEYMACAKPFITTPVSQDVIKNNDVGLILKRDFTKKEVINKLNNLIEDKGLRAKLGQNGLKKIKKSFTWEKLMNDMNRDIINLM